MNEFRRRLQELERKKRETPRIYEGNRPPQAAPKRLLTAGDIPKFVTPLPVPDVLAPCTANETSGVEYHAVDMSEFRQQMLPAGFPATTVWGYGGFVRERSTQKIVYRRGTPGPTFETVRGRAVKVQWFNRLFGPPPLREMRCEPGKEPLAAATAPHLHGGEISSLFDGHPAAWFTASGEHGPAYRTDCYTYRNTQQPAALWYHDHAAGAARIHTYAGLAGFYLLRDPANVLENPGAGHVSVLPHGAYEVPLLLQARSFYEDGSLALPQGNTGGAADDEAGFGFYGDCSTVNGVTWPNLDVERRRYRFRVLNASSGRFYRLHLSNGLPLVQIGTDGGFCEYPAALGSLPLAPGERADIVVDFSYALPGSKILLLNRAGTGGAISPEDDPVSQVMQFTVASCHGCTVREPSLPGRLNVLPRLLPDCAPRTFLLLEPSGGADGKAVSLPDLQHYPTPQAPLAGATEEWVFVNLTPHACSIHTHLVPFLICARQPVDAKAYLAQRNRCGSPGLSACMLSGRLPAALSPEPFAAGAPRPAAGNERGWKDTVGVGAGELLRIRVRFAPQDTPSADGKPGVSLYPFLPWRGPGYVWSCTQPSPESSELLLPLLVQKVKSKDL